MSKSLKTMPWDWITFSEAGVWFRRILFISQSYNPPPCSHELWVMTEIVRSRIKTAGLEDTVRSLEIQEEAGFPRTTALSHWKELEKVIGPASWRNSRHGIPTGSRPQDRPRTLRRDYIFPPGLRMSQDPQEQLKKVARKKGMWTTLLKLQSRAIKAVEDGEVDGWSVGN